MCPPHSQLCDPGLAWQVLRNKGVYESVKYIQQENFWIGPSSVRGRPGDWVLTQPEALSSSQSQGGVLGVLPSPLPQLHGGSPDPSPIPGPPPSLWAPPACSRCCSIAVGCSGETRSLPTFRPLGVLGLGLRGSCWQGRRG